MKIAIIGANGQLGSDLVEVITQQGHEVVALTHADIQIARLLNLCVPNDGFIGNPAQGRLARLPRLPTMKPAALRMSIRGPVSDGERCSAGPVFGSVATS